MASLFFHKVTVQILLENKIDKNQTNKNGQNALDCI